MLRWDIDGVGRDAVQVPPSGGAATPALGDGAHLWLAEPLAPLEQELRAAHPNGRGLDIHRHDPHHLGYAWFEAQPLIFSLLIKKNER